MAYLHSPNGDKPIYLKPFHRIGRFSGSVDTLIDNREISRIHAIIEWLEGQWFIRDLSKNGIWINHVKLTPNQSVALQLNDHISFSHKNDSCFRLCSVDKPQNMLVYHSSTNDTIPEETVVLLHQYHLLPCEKDPEVILYYDADSHRWQLEATPDFQAKTLNHGDLVTYCGHHWQFIELVDEAPNAETVDISNHNHDWTCVFYLSQDEEICELKLQGPDTVVDLEVRSHHYLSALLARYRFQDQASHIDQQLGGWVSVQKLEQDLGLSQSHINIQIHRARKQIADKLSSQDVNGPILIERKKGHVRFAAEKCRLFKGKTLELDASFG